MSERRRSRLRDALFALLVTVVVLLAANQAVELLERRGVVDTRRADDTVLYVESDLFEVDPEPHYVTTDYANASGLVPARFRADKRDGWRMFLLGASFVQGSPYTFQGHGVEMPGGMASWLRDDLARWGFEQHVEVVNLGVGGQNSFRVAGFAEAALQYEPDVLFVATCNNEGALSPSRMREQLHKLGGYRLLTKYLSPSPGQQERPYFTPQDEDSKRLAKDYRRNIRRIIRASEEAGVPLLLGTLPINRQYTGRIDSAPITEVPSRYGPLDRCVAEAIQEMEHNPDLDEVLAAFDGCDQDLPDAVRWRGITLLRAGRYEEARASLDQSIELQPRNRCRPSLNAIVREEAAASANTTLVDLDAAASALVGGHGIAGEELFVDFCHMNWLGYAGMAAALLDELERSELLPADGARPNQPLDVETLARRHGLNRLRFVAD
jgi:tetratricopeptide (TPR) repeat protein